jgi:hypothetical protein
MDQMLARDHVLSETQNCEVSNQENHAVYQRETRQVGSLLLALSAVFTILAVGVSVPFTGFAALMTVFIGGSWLSYRSLMARWAKFRNLPITPLNRT